jgi:secreted PhoX family phosphatase
MDRREFLQFLGVSGVLATAPLDLWATKEKRTGFNSLPPNLLDKFVTMDGLDYKVLIRWGEQINATEKFGFNNDFIAYHPLKKDNAILWVNHEYVHPLFINGIERTKKNVDDERLEVGGTLIEVKNEKGFWSVVKNSKYNRRLTANTEIPFAWDLPIKGSKTAIGTLAGCAGGKTPWGTILSCEENYDMFWGERDRKGVVTKSYLGWDEIYSLPPEHYGWVVEIEPLTGKAKKLVSMGRFCHECAAVTKAKNGKVVAYSGDDTNNEHFYKFISDSESSLEKGKLYVANLEKGEWLSLDINEQEILKKTFKDQTEVQIYAREAAKLVGATALDRPEDIEFDPLTGNVLVTLTNNKSKNNYYGSILKIMEKDGDPGALKFSHGTFLTGGKESGFACPDNMIFDPKGNLWFTCDISGEAIEKGPYTGFGNNSLFVFLRSGARAGEIIRVASGPMDAEFTGPCFSPDYKTLFLSVQHPGELSTSKENPTSHWPDGGMPRPSVVTLQGPLLDRIVQGKM